MNLQVSAFKKAILTHLLVPIGPVPPVLDTDSVYPYQSYCETSTRPVLKSYQMIKLENSFVEVLICPDLGGKVYSLKHKPTGKECLYVPNVIRHSRILPRFSFVAGGIEVSFPISHTPSQNEHVHFEIQKDADRIYVSLGETELRYGMQWTVEYSLGEEDYFLTQRTLFHNPTGETHPWMSWSNAAVPAYPDSTFHFPRGQVLLHSDELKTIDWETEGPRTNSDIEQMSGYFWHSPKAKAFGCFSPSAGIGLYHIADIDQVPGMKLWSYGEGRDKEWSFLSSLNRQSYLEIQAGPIGDQSMKYELHPGERHCHTEFWVPTVTSQDIYAMEVSEIRIRPEAQIPLFSYAKQPALWNVLIDAYEANDISMLPLPPLVEKFDWPPCGLSKLDGAFQWAIQQQGPTSLWILYFGVWLMAKGDIARAKAALEASGHDLARAVLARFYHQEGKTEKARKQYEQMKEEVWKLHPQIVVERDRLLEKCGEDAFEERALWLQRLDALDDDALLERKISLLIDTKNFAMAKELLEGRKFQRVHQRYERKRLWKQLCDDMGMDVQPYPDNLGEDNLAEFGAYREF